MTLDELTADPALKAFEFMRTDRGVLYCGDCAAILPLLPAGGGDVALTDPPYGVNMDKGFGGAVGFGGQGKAIKRREYLDDKWDAAIPDKAVFDAIRRVCKNQMFFGGNFFAHILPQASHWIFWDKNMTMPTFGDGELIWTSFNRKSVKKEFFQFNGLISDSADKRQHPTQKPSELVCRLIRNYTEPGQIVLDCFMGSGTTALACEKEGRFWVGVEREEKYCRIAKERIEAEAAQGKLFL